MPSGPVVCTVLTDHQWLLPHRVTLNSTLSDDDIRTAIKNSGGVRGSLLLPDAPFELLVRRAIGRLLPPALQCKDFVFAELQRIATHSIPPDVQRFPALQVGC